MSVLSEEMGISVSAMTQIADRMERSGLVERVIGVEDRRQKLLQLTEYGAELMKTRTAMRVQRAVAALQMLSPEEREQTLAAINKLMEVVYATTPPVPQDETICIRQEQS